MSPGQFLMIAILVAALGVALFINTITDLREREERQRHEALLDELRHIESKANHPTSRRHRQ